MIVKISRGNDPGNLMKYLVGPGKQNEHTLPHAVSGSLGGMGQGELSESDASHMAEDMRNPGRLFDVKVKGGNIWHASLAIGADEGKLSDQTWRSVADQFMRDMGVVDPVKAPVRWTAVHHGQSSHGNDHIHIAMSLVREDGTKVNTWQDMVKASKVAAGIEKKYGLKQVAGRTDSVSPQPYSKDDAGRAKDQNTEPRRQQIEVKVRAAAAASSNEAEFVSNLEQQGLRFKVKRDTNGKVLGYSVNLPETTTLKGQEHWWAGSKLARDLSLPRLRQQWATPPLKVPTQAAALRELKSIATAAPAATAEQLAVAAHQVSGALAVAAKSAGTNEKLHANLSSASRECGKIAQTKTFTWKASPPALSITTMMLATHGPDAAQAVMLRQLLATMSAVQDAHRARRVKMAGEDPADEFVESAMTLGVTAGARLLEQHARGREAEHRVTTQPGTASGSPSSTRYTMSSRPQGQLSEDSPDQPRKEAGDVVTVTATGMSTGQQEKLQQAANERDPEQWKTGHEPLSQKQAYNLQQKGLDPHGVTKAEASLIIGGKAKTVDEARERVAQRMAMAAPEAPLTAAPKISTTNTKTKGRGK